MLHIYTSTSMLINICPRYLYFNFVKIPVTFMINLTKKVNQQQQNVKSLKVKTSQKDLILPGKCSRDPSASIQASTMQYMSKKLELFE